MSLQKTNKIRIGTRGSKLALVQASYVAALLKKRFPKIKIELVKVSTTGDRFIRTPLDRLQDKKYSGKGFFVKELEEALLKGKIDVAVHSLKDVPALIPFNLKLSAFLKRETVDDILVSKKYEDIKKMPEGSKLGTSSPRRKAQAKALNQKLTFVPIRGNIETRLDKVADGLFDATILAAAGLKRLGIKRYRGLKFTKLKFIPSAGQGMIAVESRFFDREIHKLLSFINDKSAEKCALAERKFLKMIGGDCHTPIAAYARSERNRLCVEGFAADVDGRKIIKKKFSGKEPSLVASKLAKYFLKAGARKLIGLKKYPYDRTVLFTGLKDSMSRLKNEIRKDGNRLIGLPLIKIVPPEDNYASLDCALKNIKSYDFVIFTSKNAVSPFVKRCKYKNIKIAAVGAATAERLKKYGFKVWFNSPHETSEHLGRLLVSSGVKGKKILFLRAKEGLNILPEMMKKAGANLDLVTAYRTVPSEINKTFWIKEFSKRKPNVIYFTSPSTVASYFKCFGKKFISNETEIVPVGSTTEKMLRNFMK